MKFRKKIYEQFAANANQENIQWIVLHGIEGYPKKVGRDLDITCKTHSEENLLINIFENCLQNAKEAKWIIKPSPIWGKRILGINSDLDVAELHIIRPLRSGIIEFVPDWNSINYIGTFPSSPFMKYAKTIVMPALSENYWKEDKGGNKINDKDVPLWLKKFHKKHINNSSITKHDALLMMAFFFISHPFASFKNIFKWAKIKYSSHRFPTTPIIKLDIDVDSLSFERKVMDKMSAVFLDVKCGDTLTKKQILRFQARQQLIYIKKKEIPYDLQITKPLLEMDAIDTVLIDHFKKFNLKWYYEKK